MTDMSDGDSRAAQFADLVKDGFDLDLLTASTVVLIGVGSVGSRIATTLATTYAIGNMRFVDHDIVQQHNLRNQAYDRYDINQKKADCLRSALMSRVPGFTATAVLEKVDDEMSNRRLDSLLREADLVIIATDEIETQRRVADRCLRLRIVALLPAVWEGGGEVFVQFDASAPCYLCWDLPTSIVRQREVASSGLARQERVAAQPDDIDWAVSETVQLAVHMLNRESRLAELTTSGVGGRPLQLFTQVRRVRQALPVQGRQDCSSCGGSSTTAPTPTPQPLRPLAPASTTQVVTPSPIPDPLSRTPADDVRDGVRDLREIRDLAWFVLAWFVGPITAFRVFQIPFDHIHGGVPNWLPKLEARLLPYGIAIVALIVVAIFYLTWQIQHRQRSLNELADVRLPPGSTPAISSATPAYLGVRATWLSLAISGLLLFYYVTSHISSGSNSGFILLVPMIVNLPLIGLSVVRTLLPRYDELLVRRTTHKAWVLGWVMVIACGIYAVAHASSGP